jgi:thioredoxin reductase
MSDYLIQTIKATDNIDVLPHTTGGHHRADQNRPGRRRPGVFAVGDVRHGSIKRVASAVGDGGISIRPVHQRLAQLRETDTTSSRNSQCPA